jgi:cell division septum initiation protein DivIVA
VRFITPAEIRHIVLKRSVGGYDRGSTDRVLADIAGSYDKVWRHRDELRNELEELEKRVADGGEHAKEVERLRAELTQREQIDHKLRNTLLAAERAAEKYKEEARASAAQAVKKAQEKAEEIVGSARSEQRRLQRELEHLRKLERQTRESYKRFLESALGEIQPQERPEPVSPLASPLGHLSDRDD